MIVGLLYIGYRQARNRKNLVFRRKERNQEYREHKGMEELYRANDTRKFYKKLNLSRKGYVPEVDMCSNLLTNKCTVIEKWKEAVLCCP